MGNRQFNILAIDGGGFKGLYSAVMLHQLEKKYGPITEHFQMICGTSTGGLIALGLAAGKSAEEIVKFYTEYGKEIFPSDTVLKRFYHNLRHFTIPSKYSNRQLKYVLERFLGEKKMQDAECYLCIPAVNLINSKGVVFKTPHSKEFSRDRHIKMVDVALATSAAPTYLPVIQIDGVSSYLVDGGLWANNPSFIGAVEAVSYFVGPDKAYDSFSILSIGNLASHKPWYPKNPKNRSILFWAKYLFGLTTSVQSNAMDYLLKIASDKELFPMGKYIRIADPHINPKEARFIDLDRADKKSISILTDLALATIGDWINKQEIKSFFNKLEAIKWQN